MSPSLPWILATSCSACPSLAQQNMLSKLSCCVNAKLKITKIIHFSMFLLDVCCMVSYSRELVCVFEIQLWRLAASQNRRKHHLRYFMSSMNLRLPTSWKPSPRSISKKRQEETGGGGPCVAVVTVWCNGERGSHLSCYNNQRPRPLPPSQKPPTLFPPLSYTTYTCYHGPLYLCGLAKSTYNFF